MMVPTNREIDAWIAENIMKLSGVGYYRRVSCRLGGWEKCNKEDKTPDEQSWGASLYYTHIPGNLAAIYSVPPYTDKIESAFEVVEVMRNSGYHFIISTISDGVKKYSVTIRGCKRIIDSMHSDLITISDISPAKAICMAVCNLFEEYHGKEKDSEISTKVA